VRGAHAERASEHLLGGERDLTVLRAWTATLAVTTVGWSALAGAQTAPPPVTTPAHGAAATANVAAPAPAPVPPPAPTHTDPAVPAAERTVGPIPTADETPPASDHDAVVGRIGIEARRFDPGPLPLALRPGYGCPPSSAGTADCQVTMGAFAARWWRTRNLALEGGVVFAAGGGRDGTQARDTYLGIGPLVGMSLLLANWRHLAVSASPQLAYVWFSPSLGDAGNTTMIAMSAALEAEVHLGFVGVPALSVGLLAGMTFQYESVAETRVWSVGVLGGNSIWGALSNLFVRYYL